MRGLIPESGRRRRHAERRHSRRSGLHVRWKRHHGCASHDGRQSSAGRAPMSRRHSGSGSRARDSRHTLWYRHAGQYALKNEVLRVTESFFKSPICERNCCPSGTRNGRNVTTEQKAPLKSQDLRDLGQFSALLTFQMATTVVLC